MDPAQASSTPWRTIGNKDEVAAAFREIGPVDVLVNNAGFSEHPTFPKTDPEAWAIESMAISTALTTAPLR